MATTNRSPKFSNDSETSTQRYRDIEIIQQRMKLEKVKHLWTIDTGRRSELKGMGWREQRRLQQEDRSLGGGEHAGG